MSAELITYPDHTLTDQDFSLVIEHLSPNSSGILYGCSFGYNTSTVVVSEGWCIVCGRLVKVAKETLSVTLPSSGTSTMYVCVVVDLSNSETPAQLKVSSSIPSTTTDFNVQNGTAYFSLGSISVSSSGIKSMTKTPPMAHLETRIVTLSYNSSTNLYGYVYFNGTVQHAVANVLVRANTPYSQVNNVALELGAHSVGGRIDINAYGTGFVNGHVLSVCIFAMVY